VIKTNQKLISTILIGTLLFSNLALAIPGVPNLFYGAVTWNGAPAPDGTTVVAKINGIEVASTTTKDGKYGYNPTFYVDDPNNDRSGEIINFFVNGVEVNTGPIYFCNACIGVGDSKEPLDLAASGGEQPSPPPSGPGGGPIGGGIYIPPTEGEEAEEEILECQERWVCSDWSECENGVQSRTCNDANNCGTRNNEPLLSQPCTTVEEEGLPAPVGITGFFLGVPVTNWIVGVVGGVIVAVIIIFLFRRRKKKK